MVEGGTPAGRVTLRRVAEVAGVSIATASYVLSGRVGRDVGVREETRVRVRLAADELGYRPRSTPGTRPRTGTVLLSLRDVGDPWSQTLVARVTTALRPDDVQVIVQVGGDWKRALAHRRVDVVVVDDAAEGRAARTAIGRLVRRGDRLILWSRTLPPRGFDVIRPNDVEALTVGLRFLFERYDTVVFLDDQHGYVGEQIRLAAALEVAGTDDRLRVVSLAPGEQPWAGALDAVLDGRHRPAAAFTANDRLARAVLAGADRLGLSVPGDLAVLGIGDSDALVDDRGVGAVTSMGETGGFDYVAELVRRRQPARSYEAEVHEVVWSVQRPGLTA